MANNPRRLELARVIHPWPPFYDARSRVLILGTIPSPKSREYGFYYGNPQNCFWAALAAALKQPAPPPSNIESKKEFLRRNGIALWDVLESCDIAGASDSSIANPIANKFSPLLAQTRVSRIFTTGKTAAALFNKLCAGEAGAAAVYLPSTSPANRAAQSKPEFAELWGQVAAALEDESAPALRNQFL